MIEPIAWLVCGAVIAAASIRADASARARWIGETAVAAHCSFVRDTWRSVVVLHHVVWIGLLIAIELIVGLLVVSGGQGARLGLFGVVAMTVALPVFGWIFTIWALVMLPASGLLLHAEHGATTRPNAPVG